MPNFLLLSNTFLYFVVLTYPYLSCLVFCIQRGSWLYTQIFDTQNNNAWLMCTYVFDICNRHSLCLYCMQYLLFVCGELCIYIYTFLYCVVLTYPYLSRLVFCIQRGSWLYTQIFYTQNIDASYFVSSAPDVYPHFTFTALFVCVHFTSFTFLLCTDVFATWYFESGIAFSAANICHITHTSTSPLLLFRCGDGNWLFEVYVIQIYK